MVDRLGELIRIQVMRAGEQAPPQRPRPRPDTAVERVKHRMREAEHNALVARLIRRRNN